MHSAASAPGGLVCDCLNLVPVSRSVEYALSIRKVAAVWIMCGMEPGCRMSGEMLDGFEVYSEAN